MADARTKELLPCPHCGGEAMTDYIRDGRRAVCRDCHSAGAPAFNGPTSAEERAVAAWNRRAAPQPAASDVPHDVVRAQTIEECSKIADAARISRLDDVDDWKGIEQPHTVSDAWQYAADEAEEIAANIRSLTTRELRGCWVAGALCTRFDCPALDTSTEEALRAENARLRNELACTLDELIDHNGDDMIDSRQKRADELRSSALSALSR